MSEKIAEKMQNFEKKNSAKFFPLKGEVNIDNEHRKQHINQKDSYNNIINNIIICVTLDFIQHEIIVHFS
jgi:hypothetical protein